MPLLPIRAPRLGLAFSSRAVTLVERAGRGRGLRRPRIRRILETRLPPGLIVPRESGLNIVDLEALTAEVRDMLAPLRGQSVAVSLPDQAAQMALLEFDALPRDLNECEELIRWRFREERSVTRGDAHLAYHVFGAWRRFSPSAASSAGKTRVLGISIEREIVAQYRHTCERLGLLPLSIGISSLDLFDLCQALMPRKQEIFFAHDSTDGWTFLGVREGMPALMRVKNRRDAGMQVSRELLGTLQYYQDLVSEEGGSVERPDQCMWLVDTRDRSSEDAEELPDAPWQALPLGDALHLGLHSIPIHRLTWESFTTPKRRVQDCPASGLPALAGILAA